MGPEYRIRIVDTPSAWLSDQQLVVSTVDADKLDARLAEVRNCYPAHVVVVTAISEMIAQYIEPKTRETETERGVQANDHEQNCGGNESGTEVTQR